MTDRRKPGLAFWATVVLVMVLAYVASFGAARWLAGNGLLPGWLLGPLNAFYMPFSWGYRHGPQWLSDAIRWYGLFFNNKAG
jgi:hypothetical protein